MASTILADNGVSSGSAGIKTTADSTGALALQTTTAGGAATTAVTIDTSQNVGIGTSSPATKLTVFNTASDYQIELGYASTYSWKLGRVAATGSLAFTGYNGGATVNGPVIDLSGNLLVGVTSGGPNQLATVSSVNSKAALQARIGASGDVGTRAVVIEKYDNNTTTSQIFVQFTINNTATASGQINANGANQAAFGSWSDARLKENIETLPPQLANICSLRPVEFDYIESEGGGHQIGFIAQEIKEVYPDAVGERQPDGMLTVTGWSKTEARLVKAIQEQQALINNLTERLAALEAK